MTILKTLLISLLIKLNDRAFFYMYGQYILKECIHEEYVLGEYTSSFSALPHPPEDNPLRN